MFNNDGASAASESLIFISAVGLLAAAFLFYCCGGCNTRRRVNMNTSSTTVGTAPTLDSMTAALDGETPVDEDEDLVNGSTWWIWLNRTGIFGTRLGSQRTIIKHAIAPEKVS